MAQTVKSLPIMCETQVQSLIGKISRLIFWPGEFHGQRSLVSYNGVAKSQMRLSN